MDNDYPGNGSKNKKLIVLIIAAVVIVGIVLLTVLLPGGGGTPKANTSNAAAQIFLDAVTAHDANKSYAIFSDGLKKKIAADSWKTQVDLVFKNYGKRDPTFVSARTVEGEAPGVSLPQEIIYDLVFDKLGGDSNVKYRMTMIVIKEAGSWKINELSSDKQ